MATSHHWQDIVMQAPPQVVSLPVLQHAKLHNLHQEHFKQQDK